MRFHGLVLGVPKEIMAGERRVALTPDTVGKMVAEGAKVLVQTGAGEGSYLTDEQYQEAGAALVADVEELLASSHIVLKVKEPLFSEAKGKHEIEMMREGQYLLAFLHPASPANLQMVQRLASRGIIALTMDSIPRLSRAQSMDALTSMSTVAGYKAALIAANALPRFMPMLPTAGGMIAPATALVIGAGVAGLQAIATAKRLGAVVQAADIRPEACEQAQTLGATIVDVGVPPEIAIGEGGYAKRLPEEWLLKEREALSPRVAEADIVILAALIPGRRAPILVTEQMVRSMRKGSVIVDVSIDQGGNCDVTEVANVIDKDGVTIVGTQNIPATLPVSSTSMFANNLLSTLEYLVKDGKVELNMNDEVVASMLVTRDGRIVHAGALEAMALRQ